MRRQCWNRWTTILHLHWSIGWKHCRHFHQRISHKKTDNHPLSCFQHYWTEHNNPRRHLTEGLSRTLLEHGSLLRLANTYPMHHHRICFLIGEILSYSDDRDY